MSNSSAVALQPSGNTDRSQLSASCFQQLEACFQSLERRVQELEKENHLLKTTLNAKCPCYRLPPEVLSRIFVILSGLWSGNRWIRVTWTCSYWRSVAVDCAALWTNIPFFNPDFTEASLVRSKGAPLSIDFKASSQQKAEAFLVVLKKALSQTTRLRQIKLNSPELSRILKSTRIIGDAPLLESLSLEYTSHQRWTHKNIRMDPWTWPRGLSGIHMRPSILRKLTIINCDAVPWRPFPMLPDLVDLYLQDVRFQDHDGADGHSVRRSFEDHFSTIMKLTPGLRHLSLSNVWSDDVKKSSSPIAPWPHPRIPLPSLQSLYLELSSKTIVRILQILAVPAITALEINVIFRGSNPSTIHRLLADMNVSWISATATTKNHVTAMVCTDDTHNTDASTMGPHFVLDFERLHLEIAWDSGRHSSFEEMMHTLADVYDLSRLNELSFSRSPLYCDWDAVWERFVLKPCLSNIFIENCPESWCSFAETLAKDPALKCGVEPGAKPSPPFFPGLTELGCHAVGIEGYRQVVDSSLLEALRARSTLGFSLLAFTLEMTDFDEDDFEDKDKRKFKRLHAMFPALKWSHNFKSMENVLGDTTHFLGSVSMALWDDEGSGDESSEDEKSDDAEFEDDESDDEELGHDTLEKGITETLEMDNAILE